MSAVTNLLKKIVAVAPEMGADDLTVVDLTEALATGQTVIEEFPEGFAVVNVEGSCQTEPGAYLWLFYIYPEYRGQKIGRLILRAVIAKHAGTYFIRLKCYGAKRATWFARNGFKIVKRDGELRTMTERGAS